MKGKHNAGMFYNLAKLLFSLRHRGGLGGGGSGRIKSRLKTHPCQETLNAATTATTKTHRATELKGERDKGKPSPEVNGGVASRVYSQLAITAAATLS